jgi:putative ABC transport system permease protein
VRTLFGIPVDTLAVVLAFLVGTSVAVVGALAVRNIVFFRLGVRNVGRRRGRSALIVVGLMLSTAIIAAALGTGDTMGRTIRESVLSALGNSDEWITVKGAPSILAFGNEGTGSQTFNQNVAAAIDARLRGTGLVDGILPAIVRSAAVQDRTSRQTEPRVTLFAPDAGRVGHFVSLSSAGGRSIRLSDLRPGEVLINHRAADALDAHAGDDIVLFSGGHLLQLRVADVVDARGLGTADSALVMPLAEAQRALAVPGQVEQILVSNRGGETGGVVHTDAVVQRLRSLLARHGLEAQPVKRDGMDSADTAGSAFMSMFSTFGSFSIAAGILLIFLIFVMLAAERRTEMGVARAIGTKRGHLVETFLFEGTVYDLGAAAIGALLGIGVSLAMVAGIGRSFAETGAIRIEYSVKWPSIVVAYTLGVLLTFLVVAFSSWRVSMLNIVSAVRNLPDPARESNRRWRLVGAVVALLFGLALVASGRSGAQAMPFMMGVSLLCVGIVPILHSLGVPDRISFTVAGFAVVVLWLLPFRVIESLVPGAQMDFSIWVVGGLLIVLGSVWVVIYNADALLGATVAVLGRIRSLTAVLRISMAYPLRNRLRTGMTLAMFTLVVFTLVVGITTPSSFITSLNNTASYGGGYDVRAMSSPASPITDIGAALRMADPAMARSVRHVASLSTVAIEASQASATGVPIRKYVDYPIHGLDSDFLARNRYALGSRARGFRTDAAVWDAIARGERVAVVDPWIVPHRRKWSFGAFTDMQLSGFYAEDPVFTPVPLDVRDPETGTVEQFTIIGVLRDTMPLEMAGIATSQRALQSFGGRAAPTAHLFALEPGVDPRAFARRLESVFLANGMEADSFAELVHDNVSSSMVFLRLIEGFMGLGLVVGVAALGVIAARSVVERRQQIGVMRAVGFRASTVRLGFLLESSFLALTSIIVGTALGLALAYNVIDDAQRQATWPSVRLVIPWGNLAVIFAVVMLVALATTYLPARHASRVYPAEALRYE